METPPVGGGEADREVRLPSTMARLERATAVAESPIRRIVGSGRLNPLPHAGTISVFLLIVVTLTGLYLTFFFEFGFAESYGAIARMQAHPIQRTIRALHRYSSAALVVTTLVHAWRTFASRRFTGPRRWRWVSGSLALGLVWLAGVTGYWLIWDTRAQALTEAFASMVGSISSAWEVAMLRTNSTGWVPLLTLWFIHFVLTAIIGYALWRHVRKTRHAWLPRRRWMFMMGGALVLISIVLPPELLPAASPGVIPGSMPLDPFVMFLLPPLLGSWPWGVAIIAIVIATVGTVLPWLLRRNDPPIARVVADLCTGCELCVIDCPYLALTMSSDAEGAIAVVDTERCVGCGICVGSCSFGAIDGFGVLAVPPHHAGATILACSRHFALGGVPDDANVIEVRCTGVLNPRTVSSLIEAGASSVNVIGCPPGDCTYGVGNLLTSERIEGTRRPHVARAWADRVTQDWIAPGSLVATLQNPNQHTAAGLDDAPPGWRRWVPAVAIVAVSIALIGLATGIPFSNEPTNAEIRVIVDHRPGSVLEGAQIATGGFPMTVEVLRGGEPVGSAVVARSGERVEAVVEVPVEPGEGPWEVRLVEGSDSTTLESFAAIDAGRRAVTTAIDAPPPPGAELGEALFSGNGLGENLGCEVCHSLNPGQRLVGPSLAGIGTAAADRVPGLEAAGYIRQSIVDPDAYTVPGYPAGQMLQDYEDRLSPEELEGLVTYLMTLTEADG